MCNTLKLKGNYIEQNALSRFSKDIADLNIVKGHLWACDKLENSWYGSNEYDILKFKELYFTHEFKSPWQCKNKEIVIGLTFLWIH